MVRVCVVVLLLAPLAACGGKSSSPISPDAPGVLLGQTINAISGTAAPNLNVRVGTRAAVTSDGQGLFEIDMGDPGVYQARIQGNAIVERETVMTVPAHDRTRISLIPTTFDLTAFDEMFRTTNQQLQRWTSRPALIVLASVMNYRKGGGNEYEATDEQLDEQEVNQMIAHLSEGLALLTGNAFTSFESVQVERPAKGEEVRVLRTGSIVVGRYNGIVTFVNTIGYGQWADEPNGTVTGGSMFLDRDFDKNDSRRRLLRIHELGHALGYLHVTTRTSIMNPAIGPEPTDFDRSAALIAFQRPPGNRAPDIDPSTIVRGFSLAEGGSRWAPPVICR